MPNGLCEDDLGHSKRDQVATHLGAAGFVADEPQGCLHPSTRILAIVWHVDISRQALDQDMPRMAGKSEMPANQLGLFALPISAAMDQNTMPLKA